MTTLERFLLDLLVQAGRWAADRLIADTLATTTQGAIR